MLTVTCPPNMAERDHTAELSRQDDTNLELKEIPPMNQLKSIFETQESMLRSIIKFMITNFPPWPKGSAELACEYLSANEPALYNLLGRDRVLDLCEEALRSEDSAQSEWYRVRFYQFNNRYFGGALFSLRICGVYCVNEHIQDTYQEGVGTYIDLRQRVLLLRAEHYFSLIEMDSILLRCMAHAVVGNTQTDDPRFLAEIERLIGCGARVFLEDAVGMEKTSENTSAPIEERPREESGPAAEPAKSIAGEQ